MLKEVQESSPLTRVREKKTQGVFQPLHRDNKKPVAEEKYFSDWLVDYGACWVNSSGHASTEFSLSAEMNLVEFCLPILYNSLQLSTPPKFFF